MEWSPHMTSLTRAQPGQPHDHRARHAGHHRLRGIGVLNLKQELSLSIQVPTAIVTASYPGVSPQIVADDVSTAGTRRAASQASPRSSRRQPMELPRSPSNGSTASTLTRWSPTFGTPSMVSLPPCRRRSRRRYLPAAPTTSLRYYWPSPRRISGRSRSSGRERGGPWSCQN